MDPVTSQVEVRIGPAEAFAKYTDQIDLWWPRSHHIGDAGIERVVLEPAVGGRIYQVDKAGAEHVWSTIRSWNPPYGFVASWELGPTFEVQTDPGLASEFEVSFGPGEAATDTSTTPATSTATVVRVEHRDFAKHGPEAGGVIASAVNQANGWSDILAYFKRRADVVEPPTRADEPTTLSGFLDHFRSQLVDRAFGLTDEQLQISAPPSSLTLSRLIGHMALVELWWFRDRFAGQDIEAPFEALDFDTDPDAEMTYAQSLSGADLVETFWACVADSQARVRAAESLDELSTRPHPRTGEHWSLRWILVHMIEEYARHCGHADMIRESIDGDLA